MILLCAFYFAFLPFSFALPIFPGIDLPLARLGAVIIVLIFLATSFAIRRLSLPLSLPAFFLSTFLLVATLSFSWAANEAWAIRKIIFLWSFLPLYFMLVSLIADDRDHKIIRAAVWGGFFAALVGLLQFFLQFIFGVDTLFTLWLATFLPVFLGGNFGEVVAMYPSLLVNVSGSTLMRASAFFPDPHIFAFYMGMLAPLAAGLGWNMPAGSPRRRAFFLLAFTLLLADLLSFSRGGYAGLLLGGAVFGVLFFQKKRISQKTVFLGLIMAALLLGSIMFSPVGSRLSSSFSPTDGSSVERLRLWSEAASNIKERPLLGTGLGNYPLLVKPSAAFREPIYVHNIFLDIAVELGLIGLLIFCGFLLSVLGILWKKWRNQEDTLALCLIVSLSVFIGHGLFETPIFSVHVLPLLMLITALSALPLKETKKV